MYLDISNAFLGQLHNVVYNGDIVNVKGTETKENLFASFTIEHPWDRVMMIKGRNDNIFAKIAETLWVLAGRNDMDFLSYYLPRAPQWSDDGETWRAGYGPRLRRWEAIHQIDKERFGASFANKTVDQLKEVVNHLKENKGTRQAIISIWDPAQDWVESKDIPCNNWLHFIERRGKLPLDRDWETTSFN